MFNTIVGLQRLSPSTIQDHSSTIYPDIALQRHNTYVAPQVATAAAAALYVTDRAGKMAA